MQAYSGYFPRTTLRIGCKINLSLQILGVRPNGWHELDTLFVPLEEPHDDLELVWTPKNPGLSLRCSVPGIDPRRNTLTSAYKAYADVTGFRPSLTATLRKGIPHGAGLGGGSADAAALLLWLNGQNPNPLTFPELLRVAAHVGADVSFFLYNRPCRGTGTGETLEPSDCLDSMGLRGVGLILLCPRVHVSTPRAYTLWDAWQMRSAQLKSYVTDQSYGTKKSGQGLTEKDDAGTYLPSQGLQKREERAGCPVAEHSVESSVLWLENSFETPIFEEHPRLRRLKEQLFQVGAFAAVMSGSGSSLFGLFRNTDTGSIAETFREKDVTAYSHVL